MSTFLEPQRRLIMRNLLIGVSLVSSLLGGVAAADEGYRRPVEVRPVVEERVEVRRPAVERRVEVRRPAVEKRVEARRPVVEERALVRRPAIEVRNAYPVVEHAAYRDGYVWIPGSYRRVDGRWAFMPGHYQRLVRRRG
jgi:hypothetical protein